MDIWDIVHGEALLRLMNISAFPLLNVCTLVATMQKDSFSIYAETGVARFFGGNYPIVFPLDCYRVVAEDASYDGTQRLRLAVDDYRYVVSIVAIVGSVVGYVVVKSG